tara:strand:- start:40 stop:246 length:207 start_codon:yes stop_codon:yes gene_type:complete
MTTTINIIDYIEDKDCLEYYLTHFDTDELEDFIYFISKLGNNKENINKIFFDEDLFEEFYNAFLVSID